MDNSRKIGILLVAVAVIVGVFGIWLKTYNDKLAQIQYNETGSCYLADGTCLHSTSDAILYSAVGIAVFLAAIGVYMLLRKTTKTETKKIHPQEIEIPKTLSGENKAIFDIISQSDGAILQSELVEKSGMDKVKVSRILDKLEMQGLIERRRHGMSNLVVLKKK